MLHPWNEGGGTEYTASQSAVRPRTSGKIISSLALLEFHWIIERLWDSMRRFSPSLAMPALSLVVSTGPVTRPANNEGDVPRRKRVARPNSTGGE